MGGSWIKECIDKIPSEPGVYLFKSSSTVLYIGKAVDLKDRIRSYKDPKVSHIKRMIKKANDIDFTVTDTETQALLLEANLIKKYNPKYNIRLTDDKSYPYIQLTDHKYPKIEITRNPEKDADVFGPFTNKSKAETVLKALRQTYGTRGCSDHKFANRKRPCIDYEIGICTAPCTGKIKKEKYTEDVESVKTFLKGATWVLADPLREEMEKASKNKQYEKAASLRDKINVVENFHGGKGETVKSQNSENKMDVLAGIIEGKKAIVARMRSEDGKLIKKETHSLDLPEISSSLGEVLGAFISQFYAERSLPDTLVLSEKPQKKDIKEWLENEGVKISVPRAGRKARLIDLALKNIRHRKDKKKGVSSLEDALNIENIKRIEGFDISHTGGKDVVGSNVLFIDGEPKKSGYRRKKLSDYNDDYTGIYKMVKWRAKRAKEKKDSRKDPDLLLIDGGKSQLSAAKNALKDTGWQIPTVALAKKEEKVFTSEGKYNWSADSSHLHLLQRIRDEAHRFAVQYHEKLRNDIKTSLDKIEGIGPELRKKLLKKFGSIEGIKSSSLEELTEIQGIGQKTAEKLKKRL